MSATGPAPTFSCPTCGPIGERAYACWKDSDPEWGSSNIPPSAARLEHVSGDESASGGRGRGIRRCPDCGAMFQWIRGYEFLIGGSEDEEELIRLTPDPDSTRPP